MARQCRVLLLVHPYFRPDRKIRRSQTEYDVWRALLRLGHQVEICAEQENLRSFDKQLASFKPHIVFNLLEEFREEGIYDFHLVSFLESLGIPSTGCNPRGLILSRNKFASLSAAAHLGIAVPKQALYGAPLGHGLGWPRILKFNREHASLGIQKSNVVSKDFDRQRVYRRMMKLFEGEVLEQEFISGQEVTVSVWGNDKPQSFRPWRLHLKSPQDLATERVKFSSSHRRQTGIRATRFTGALAGRIERQAKVLFKGLDLNGYVRFDFRIRENTPYLIDVNANPNLSKSEDLATSANACGINYLKLIQGIVNLGLSYEPRR